MTILRDEVLLASSGWSGMLVSTLQFTGQTLRTKNSLAQNGHSGEVETLALG